MVLLRLAEYAFIFLGILFVVTQVLVPAFMGTALFPLFRHEAKLEAEAMDVNQAIREQDIQNEISKKRESLNKGKGERHV